MNYNINITEYFENTCRDPNLRNTIAIKEGDQSVTFSELHELVVRIASFLQKSLDNSLRNVIAVMIPKSINSIALDLAILYSGNVYLNLDVKNPDDRINAILAKCNVSFLIENNKTSKRDIKVPRYNIDEILKCTSVVEDDIEFNNVKLIDIDPLCVITTSGSTGIPKAVMLTHKGLIDYMEEIREEQLITSRQIIGSLSPSFFDHHCFEIVQMCALGSTIVILPSELAAFPIKLLAILKQENVSFIFWVPTIMVNIANLDLLSKISLPELKTVWFAGEIFPTSKFNYWRQQLPDANFVNLYGPTEISVDCTYYKVEKDLSSEDVIPIGKPFRNTQILLLDEDLNEVKEGETGEIYVRGCGVSLGYFNDAEKTASAFIQNPVFKGVPNILYKTGDLAKKESDGNYIFLGRIDNLIKRSGYRIELGEIEHTIVDSLALFRNCCVVYDSASKDLILAYEADTDIEVRKVLTALQVKLPKYMLPNKFFRLNELPRNATGKINRKLILAMFLEQK